MTGVLYISYDGMLEPLGQSQVLAYLERLSAGRTVHLLSFEKPDDWADVARRKQVAARIAAGGIQWHPRRYHKRPSALATAYDVMVGTLTALWLSLRHRLRLLHARSDVPALMAWPVQQLTGARFLFDMRAFWADERVDGGLWPRDGRLYRLAKWFERRFFLAADHLISLTHSGVRELEQLPCLRGRLPATTVIPTCADLARFRILGDRPPGLTLGYVGTVGTWYLFDETVAAFAELIRLRPQARILIVNRNEHDYIRERLIAGGIPLDAVELRAADHADMPQQMARMTASVFFIKPVFSKQASAPTKLGELLGCGLPCLSNTGVGDMAEILLNERVGVAIDAFDASALRQGLAQLLELVDDPCIRDRCVATARKYFSLEDGVARYESVYRRLGA